MMATLAAITIIFTTVISAFATLALRRTSCLFDEPPAIGDKNLRIVASRHLHTRAEAMHCKLSTGRWKFGKANACETIEFVPCTELLLGHLLPTMVAISFTSASQA
jgi:hypothetical protein